MIVVEVNGSWKADGLDVVLRNALENALSAIAEDLCVASQAEVPVDTGALKESVTVEKIEDDSGQIVYFVSYGKEYAVEQHENLNFFHSHGKAKFLEDPFQKQQHDMISHLQASVGNAMKEALGS